MNSVREDERQILFVIPARSRMMCEFSLEFLQSAPFHSVVLFALAFSKMDKSKARVSFLARHPWQHSQDTSLQLAPSSSSSCPHLMYWLKKMYWCSDVLCTG